eukprot:CAMPEP_0197920870 /NCGR_PEP_ID=MMETSP1439-20131203/89706_1 /TAXON_ID=66791 /ORGANISM="Gonyaulax spinifera, Strain CCMP409" /LENGTH=51 /DNA_ID=CAMNT_0043543095 /DNA_START=8 /DNA_END=163 /DNA_ORIENTATION=+
MGLHSSLRTFKQISPFSPTFGWKHGVTNLVSGGLKGYVSGNFMAKRKVPPA